MRLTKNGITIDVHEIRNGEVLYRKWMPGVKSMPFLIGLRRMPVAEFEAQAKGAKRR